MAKVPCFLFGLNSYFARADLMVMEDAEYPEDLWGVWMQED